MRIIINGLTTIMQNLDVLNAIIINCRVTIVTDNHSLKTNPIPHITDEMLDDLAVQQEYERSEEYDGVNAWRF